jgi:hypothetical protein
MLSTFDKIPKEDSILLSIKYNNMTLSGSNLTEIG